VIVANNQDNIARALERLEITLNYDSFSQKPIVKYNGYFGPLEDRIRNRMWLDIDRQFHFRPSPDYFDVVIQDIADKNRIHPVREYLKKLEWDGQPRIDTWLIRSGNAADSKFVRTVSALVLIAAVRRVMHPGCKFDEIMILESGQGELKSSVLRALCADDSWFSDDLPLNVDSKQIIERTTGKWIIEAQELSGMRKSQREHLKSVLSRQTDGPVRMAYDRLPREQPRQFIVIGTTNDHNYLTDPTGNRRIWPVRVERFNLNLVYEERDQWWAEAAAREAKGESIRLPQELWDHAAFQQERRRQPDAWEERIEMNFDEAVCRIAPEEIWECLAVPIERRNDQAQQRVYAIMQRLGFRRMTVQDKRGRKVKGWGRGNKRPGEISTFFSKEETGEPQEQEQEPEAPPQDDDM
jgi:predicted P-loop ATPase